MILSDLPSPAEAVSEIANVC